MKTGLYRHFKGQNYRVIGLAQHSESEEELVVYQALYGNRGLWVRPLSMFTERVTYNGADVSRFTYLDPQTEVLEVAVLDIKPSMGEDFELAFSQAESVIASMSGYISHQLQKCLEVEHRFLLLVNWQSLEDHTQGFRQSAAYQEWRDLLHHFYHPFPTVEHYQNTA